MTVLEANQAYRAAMVILKEARQTAAREENDYTHKLIYDAQTHLTAQETRDMTASFRISEALREADAILALVTEGQS